jgi:hypothetical protein
VIGAWPTGVMTGAGGRYDGEWRDDMAIGTGTYTMADGTTHSAAWTIGCFRQCDCRTLAGTTAKECECD